MFVSTPTTSKMSRRPLSKELKLFEALENLTKSEKVDTSSSFIQKFVNSDLDLNNTQQSIATEDDVVNISSCSSFAKSIDKDDWVGIDKSRLPSLNIKGKCVSFCEEPDEISEKNFDEEDCTDEDDAESYSGAGSDHGYDQGQSQSGSESQSEDEYDEEEEADYAVTDEIHQKDLGDMVADAVMKKHSTEFLLLSEIKRSLELKEKQLERERETFTEQQKAEQKKLQLEIQRVDNQKRSLQRLIADYHKIKTSRDEYEVQMKELTDKLRETKLEMSKRITRWGDQQRKLEDRVKNLEKENQELKKKSSLSHRPAVLKRPPMLLNAAKPNQSVQSKKIHFADESGESRKSNLGGAGAGASKNPKSTRNNSSLPTDTEDTEKVVKEDENLSHSGYFNSMDHGAKYPREVNLNDADADQTMPSDYVEVKHPCGTITRVTKDNKHIRHIMLNQDVLDEFEDASVRYYYKDLQFSQTTYPNGDQIIEYDSGAVETIRADGSKICSFPSGLVKYVDSLGNEEVCFSDGSVMKKSSNGESTVIWPSGQKEVRTASYIKRIYTNGTVKIMYSDGSEETRYFNGRVRRKDSKGILVDDIKPKKKTKMKSNVNQTA